MPIYSAAFHDFGPFADAEIQCVEGLNVFIGENSTGKSHAMKATYSVLEAMRDGKDTKIDVFAGALEAKLAAVFRPDDNAVSRLVRRLRGRSSARITVTSAEGARFAATISAQGEVSASKGWGPSPRPEPRPHREFGDTTQEVFGGYTEFTDDRFHVKFYVISQLQSWFLTCAPRSEAALERFVQSCGLKASKRPRSWRWRIRCGGVFAGSTRGWRS